MQCKDKSKENNSTRLEIIRKMKEDILEEDPQQE